MAPAGRQRPGCTAPCARCWHAGQLGTVRRLRCSRRGRCARAGRSGRAARSRSPAARPARPPAHSAAPCGGTAGARRIAHGDGAAPAELLMRHHGQAFAVVVARRRGASSRRPSGAGVAVDALQVVVRQAIARHEGVARGQRVPALRRTRCRRELKLRLQPLPPTQPTSAGAHTGRPTLAARRPRPALVDLHPAAVVEWRVAPRRVVDPGPAPWRDPGPAAVAVRRPVGGDRARHPQRAVFGVVAPDAVLVEVFVAGHFGGDVTRRGGAVVAHGRAAGPSRRSCRARPGRCARRRR